MVTVATQLEDSLAEKLEALAVEKGVSSAELLSRLATSAVRKLEARRERIQRDMEGYTKFPVQPGEFLEWDEEDEIWTDDFITLN